MEIKGITKISWLVLSATHNASEDISLGSISGGLHRELANYGAGEGSRCYRLECRLHSTCYLSDKWSHMLMSGQLGAAFYLKGNDRGPVNGLELVIGQSDIQNLISWWLILLIHFRRTLPSQH